MQIPAEEHANYYLIVNRLNWRNYEKYQITFLHGDNDYIMVNIDSIKENYEKFQITFLHVDIGSSE